MQNDIVQSLRKELIRQSDASKKAGFEQFFKDPVKFYGVKTGTVRDIARRYWQQIKKLSKETIFTTCEALYKSGICEESFVVSYWLPHISKDFASKDIHVFHRWIQTYINNWASCDGFANHTVGDLIAMYPEHIQTLKKWTDSSNRWVRRASAVSLIFIARKGKHLADIFAIADRLLKDKDDMVQKGYGWMLKEASRMHQQEVFTYVMKYKKDMPRTALRYAIELMPQTLRKQAMQK